MKDTSIFVKLAEAITPDANTTHQVVINHLKGQLPPPVFESIWPRIEELISREASVARSAMALSTTVTEEQAAEILKLTRHKAWKLWLELFPHYSAAVNNEFQPEFNSIVQQGVESALAQVFSDAG